MSDAIVNNSGQLTPKSIVAIWRCVRCASILSIESSQAAVAALCPVCQGRTLELCGSFENVAPLPSEDDMCSDYYSDDGW
jgi:DNA-directed RNA polymerase subunit RPC12/RpoP